MDQAPTSPVPQSPPARPLRFTATRGAFFKLLLINTLLMIVTLGFYRFWAKTKVRQYLWSNIRFLDDPFEYTGTGTELFIGFLIVIGVLFPLGFIYTSIQTLVPPEQGWVHVALEIGYYTALFALIQIGFYRAWRYRMSRTRWRGIRLGLDGSSWTYLKLAFGWTILTALTLGLAYPWMQVELWRYQISHTRVGDQVFRFEGQAKELLRPWLLMYIPVAICGLVLVALVFHIDALQAYSMNSVIRRLEVRDGTEVFFILAAAALLPIPLILFWFGIQLDRFRISNLQLGPSRLHSSLPFARLFRFASLATSVVFIPVALIVAMIWLGEGGALTFLIFVLFFLLVLGFPLIWTVVYLFEYLKCLVETTTVSNPKALEEITQAAADALKTGEGLADALDIGGL